MTYARPYRGRLIYTIIVSILHKTFDLTPPILIGLAVDTLVAPEKSFLNQMGFEDVFTQVLIVAGGIAIAHVFESLFEYLSRVSWRKLAQSLQHDARMDAYKHVQELEMAYFEDKSTGGLLSVLNDDVNQLERFLDVGANDIIMILVTLIFSGAWFLLTAPQVAWMAVVPMPFIVIGSIWFQRRLAPYYINVREKVGILNGQLSNNLSGIATIKSFTAEAHEIGRISHHSNVYREANNSAIRFSSSFVPIIRNGVMAGFVAVMIFGGRMVIEGTLAVGIFSTLIYMSQRMLWPLTRLGETLDLYQRAMASIGRIFELLDTKPGLTDGPKSLPLSQVRGEVHFENVSFHYANGLKVVDNISLTIPAGKTVAFVGSTGSGKTTMVKLMLRFYDVTSGRITLDGIDLRDMKSEDARRAIGLVSQDVYLFHGTARENIAYGTFGASDEAIIEAAKIGEAHPFISQLPDQYETIVGERGQKLSGGQRQRISIARAVLKDPPILILDEATSAVDNETEAAIQRSLEKIAIGRTTIIIAHRLSTVRNADCIYVLQNGRVAEQGRHEHLVSLNGIYADLWRIQTGERMLEK